MSKITIRSAQLCDSVKRDERGLPIVFGVYPGKINLETRPALLEASIFCGFECDLDEKTVVQFSAVLPKARGAGEMEVSGSSKFFDIEIPVLTRTNEDGEIAFRWRVKGGKWSRPIKWKVLIAVNAEELSDEDSQLQRSVFVAKGKWLNAGANAIGSEIVPD